MNKLTTQLTDLGSKIEVQALLNTKVSESSVGWHIEHSLLVIDNIINALNHSEPSKFKQKFNFLRLIVMNIGHFPRGKAKSPKHSIPQSFNNESLKVHLKNTLEKIKTLGTIPKDKYIIHPIFGHIRTNDSIRFLEIHTNHHVKIMNDILK
jgi:hypothetical protein